MTKWIVIRTSSTIGNMDTWLYEDQDSAKKAFEIERKNLENFHKNNNISYTLTESISENVATFTVPYPGHTDFVTLACGPIEL